MARKRNKNYKIEPNQFKDIRSKEVSYILGFLWADGYLYADSIRMEIVSDDFTEIEPIFDCVGKWSKAHRNRKGLRPSSTFIAEQKPLYNILKSYGFETKSTDAPTILLDNIPEELKHYWWRGYFDGDGCFYCNKNKTLRQMVISSSYQQDWTHVINLSNKLEIENLKIKRIKHTKGHKSSRIRVCNIDGIKKFGNYIYGEKYDYMGLSRKRDKFLETIIRKVKV